jgi:hypothetical protein
MNSKERVMKALRHKVTDRVPIDLGATAQTGIGAGALFRLRKLLALVDGPIVIQETGQMLGEVDEAVRQALGVDVVGLWNPINFLGVWNRDWKPWKMPDGTPVLIAGNVLFTVDERGNILAYPKGDVSARPSMSMPSGGFFFDALIRNPAQEDPGSARNDFSDTYSVMADEVARFLERQSRNIAATQERAVVGNLSPGSFGDLAVLAAPFADDPKGIRDPEEWYAAHLLHKEYIQELFGFQTEVALQNLRIYKEAVGERIQVIHLSGTDFGTQKGPFLSPELFRELYKPFQKILGDWVHANTEWKVFYHCCGSIEPLLDDFIDAGVDILSPVQCSAEGMDAGMLKQKYGDRLVFWGGGVDTQRTLPFGTPEEVEAEALERVRTFSRTGGFVFSAIHNIIGRTPAENILSAFRTAMRYHCEGGGR